MGTPKISGNISRRSWLGSAGACLAGSCLAASACGRKKSPRYQGYALVANYESRTIAVINLSELHLLTEIPVDAPPAWVFAAPARQRAYVLSPESPAVHVIDLDRMTIQSTVRVGGNAIAAQMSADENALWIVHRQPDTLVEIRLDNLQTGRRAHLPSRGESLDVFEDGRVAVSFPESRQVGVYAAGAERLTPVMDVSPRLVRFRRDGRVLITGNTDDRSVTAIDCAAMQPMVKLPLAVAPRHFCFNDDGGQLFVTGEGMDAVVIVSPYQTEVGETILAGSAPGNMAATASGTSYLFVSNPAAGDVTVIGIDNRRVLAQIQVGARPGPILLTPDAEYALVLNEQSGDVAVIKLLNIREATLTSRRSRTAPLFTMIPVGARPISAVIAPRTT